MTGEKGGLLAGLHAEALKSRHAAPVRLAVLMALPMPLLGAIRDADDEDIMLQKELAEEVRSSMLGRKKKTTKKDTEDDIEFIDL